MNFFFLSWISIISVAIAAPQSSTTEKSSSQIPPVVVAKPGRYTFNNTEVGAVSSVDASNAPVVQEVPPEVMINGKSASQLSDEEKQKFLQTKVKCVQQADLEVKLVRVAPGYPVTFDFSEPIKNFSLGDAKLATIQNVSPKELMLTPRARAPGDTTFQVVTRSEKRFIYHIFLAENLVDADLVICVNRECAWQCWFGWIVTLGIFAALGYIFRDKIKNFKWASIIIEKLKLNKETKL